MKIYFVVVFSLLFSISSFAQVELKGFITGSSQNITFVTPTYTQASESFSIAPSIAVAINRDNKFHELQLSNISFSNNQFNFVNLPQNQSQSQQIRSITFRYSYNFYFLQKLEKWSPFVGLQTTQSIFRSKTTTSQPNSIVENNTWSLTNYQGIVPGVQYHLKDNIKLEFAIPTNLSMLSFTQDSFSSGIDWEIGVNNPFQFRLGCAVLL